MEHAHPGISQVRHSGLHLLCAAGALALLLLACSACAPADACAGLPGTLPVLRVLFVGNSYTYVNDLPGVFRQLACSAGRRVEIAQEAQGGWTLADHAASPQTLKTIQSQKWDYVVLQEQSEVPAIASARDQSMYPAVRKLVYLITAQGSMPLLFVTWGHRDGSKIAGFTGYADMQAALTSGYMGISKEMTLPVAPVGPAWQRAVTLTNPMDLWQADGSHPNPSGTYLAACVFYAAIYNQSPEGISYRAGIDEKSAHTLQTIAAETVLQGQWR
jgi:hypothetical protein